MSANSGPSVALDQGATGRIMLAALHRLLADRQSVVVELKDPRGIFTVQKVDGQVNVRPATEKEIDAFTSYDKIMSAMSKKIAV